MIKTIKVFPAAKRGEVTLELHGELATILAISQGFKNKDGTPLSRIQVSVVAGACNGYYSTGLMCGSLFEFPVSNQRVGIGLRSLFCRPQRKLQDSKKMPRSERWRYDYYDVSRFVASSFASLNSSAFTTA